MLSKNFWVALVLFTILVAFPILSNPFSYKYGPNLHGGGSDSYSLLREFAMRADPDLKPLVVDGKNMLEAFPHGMKLAPLFDFPTLFALSIAKITHSAVFGYNCSVILSFILMFLFSYLFLQRRIANENIRFLFAFLLSYTPYQIYQSVDHLTLSYLFLFPALFYFWENILEKKNFIRNLLIIVMIQGLSIFFHPYYFVMILLMNFLFVVFYLRILFTLGKINFNVKNLLQLIAVSTVMILLVLWWKKSFEQATGVQFASIKRGVSDYFNFGTRLSDFYLPPTYSFLFEGLKDWKLQDTSGHFSNIAENTLYAGMLNLGLALFYLASVIGKKRQSPHFKFLAIIVFFPLLLSLPPEIKIFSFSLPTPSALYPVLLPTFRTLSRFGVITTLGLITMSACAFEMIYEKVKSLQKKRTLLLFFYVFTLLETGNLHKLFFSDTSNVPTVYEQLKNLPIDPGKGVLEIPNVWGYVSTYWATYHHKPMFNTFESTSPNFQALGALRIKSVDDLLNFARQNNIEYIIYHSDKKESWISNPIINEYNDTMIFYETARYSYLLKVPPQ